MAKKIVVEEDENGEVRPKKKRSKCCTCCIVFLIVVLIILGAAFGVGWYFGDKYTQEYLDMPLSDVMSIFGELYWTSDKDVVKNPYSKKDLDKFYGEIKTNILLKEDADIDFDAALKDAIKSYLAETKSAQNAAVRNAGEGDSSDESSFLNIFIDMAASAFTRENIDIDKLNAYSEENDNYIFNLNDKQLAAFVNSVLHVMLDEADSMEGLEEITKVVKLSSAVALKQIRFGSVTSKDEMGIDREATTADITIWIGLQDAAGAYVESMVKNSSASWASGLAKFMTDLLLPKNLYITLSFPLYGEADTHVVINDMTKAKRDLTYKLINNVMKLSSEGEEEPQTVQSMLNGVTDQIKPFIEAASSSMDRTSASSGTIKLDLLGSLAAMTGEDPESALTKAEFMYMLQALLGSDPDVRLEQLEPHLYEGWYTDGHNAVHNPSSTDGLTKIDYSTELISEMENKYALDFPEDETTGEKSFGGILKLLGFSLDEESSGGGTDDIIGYLDSAKFRALLDVEDINSIKLNITDRMLGAVLSSQMDSLLGDMDFTFKLDAFTFVEKNNHSYALIAVELDIASMLGDLGSDNMLGALAANIMPERMVLSVMVDYTRGVERNPAEFLFNDYTNTGKVISTLARLMPSFNVEEMSEKISDTVTQMLDMLHDTLNAEPVTYNASTARSAGIQLSDIFTVITDLVLKEDDGTTTVTPQELRNILHGFYNPGEAADRENNVNENSSYSGFISSFVDKYYLNSKTEITSFTELSSFMTGLGTDFTGNKLLVKPNADESVSGKIYLAHDERSADELKPTMDGESIGALLVEKMPDNLKESFSIYNVQTDNDRLQITLIIRIDKLLPDTVQKLLDGVSELYVTAIVHFDRLNATESGYYVDIKINDMDNPTHNALIRLAQHFDPSFDVDAQVNEFGEVLYEQLGSLEDSVGDGLVSFTSRGMEFPGFYDFLAKKMNLADEYTANDLKNALQGMYAHNDEYVNENNYTEEFYSRNSSDLTLDYMFTISGGTATDAEFNDFFDSIGDILAGGKGKSGINSEQTIILAKGDTRDNAYGTDGASSPKVIREWIKNNTGNDTSDEELLIVTFKLTVALSMKGNDSSGGFLPDEIYITAIFRRNSDTGLFENDIDFIYNNLTDSQYNMISHLLGIENKEGDNTVNINSVCAQAVANLNAMFDGGGTVRLEQNDTDKDGIGKIVYEK